MDRIRIGQWSKVYEGWVVLHYPGWYEVTCPACRDEDK